jgi:hypothetical protein
MRNIKSIDDYTLNENENEYLSSEECAGYEDAVVVIMSGDAAGVDRVQWVKSVANQCDCDVHSVQDNFIFITSNTTGEASKNLDKFKRTFFK